jgi:hypothetical protein
MGGHARRTERTKCNRDLSRFGFLIGEPSNKPLKLTVGRLRRPPAA